MSVEDLLRHYTSRQSPLARISPAWKLSAGFCIILGTVVLPLAYRSWFIGVAVLLTGGVLLGRIPFKFILTRLAISAPLIVGVALAGAIQPTGHVHWSVVCVKSSLCLLAVLIISATTPIGQILQVLRHARVPGLIITTIALMYRYLAVLADESERMRRARTSRTFTRESRREWRSLASVVGQLFVRSSERADRVYRSMCARGWK